VALAAGVSQPTVSRALRDDPRVAAATRERVQRAAERLGYVSSDRGRSLSTRRSGRVAVVVEDLGNPFYLELLAALHDQLEAARLRMVVLTAPRHGDERVERLVDGAIDGAVLTTTLLDSPLPAQLRARRFPFVLLNRVVDAPGMLSCAVDNVAGARLMAEQLLRRGHRRIAAVLGPATTSTGRDRELGFRAALAAQGVSLPDELVRRGDFSHAAGRRGAGELLQRSRRPTAIFCANDVIALGAIDAAVQAGLRVPEQLSIVGFDDIGMAAWSVFELTTVRQGIRPLAAAAVELLLARLADPGIGERRVVLDPELVLRRTLGPPPA